MHDDSDTQFLGDEAIVKRSSSFIQDGQVPRNHSRNQVPRIRSILRMRGGWGLLIKSGFLLAGMSQALEPGKDVVENTGKSEEKAGGVAGKPQRCKSMQIRPTRGVFRAARPLPASHPAGSGVGHYSRADIRVGCRRCSALREQPKHQRMMGQQKGADPHARGSAAGPGPPSP
jgi:hypothetical protein